MSVFDLNPIGKKNVEDVYCGLVLDNTSCNISAMKSFSEKYPKLYFSGCVTHILSLLCKDICSIAEFNDVIRDAKFLVKFVRDHRRVKRLYENKTQGTMVQLFSETRFCGASIMLNNILKNKSHLQNLADLLKSKKYGGIAKSVRPVGGHLRPTHDFIQNRFLVQNFKCRWTYPTNCKGMCHL